MGGSSPSADAALSVTIRPAVEADLAEVVAIECASFGDAWPASAFADLLREGRMLFVVAARDGGVAGYAIAWFAGGAGELANIAVAPAMRGRGIGAALLERVLDAARREGAGETYLEVRESNAAARGLYASRGFEQVGRRRGYYRWPDEDAIVLRRTENREPTTDD